MTAALEVREWSAARPGRTLPPGKEPVPILQEAGWATGPVWTDGKSRPCRDSIPDRPAKLERLEPPHCTQPASGHLRTHNTVTAALYGHRSCHAAFSEVRQQHYSAAAGGEMTSTNKEDSTHLEAFPRSWQPSWLLPYALRSFAKNINISGDQY